jgi:transcription elongation factor S-II
MDTRDNIKTKLNEVIDDTKVVENLEKNIYDYVIQYCKDNNIIQNFKNSNFKQLYIQKSRQIYFNLKKDSYVNNQQIYKLIENKKILLENLTNYSYKQLYPLKWKKFNKDLEILNKDVSDFDKEITTTDQFKCTKCKKSKCCYTQFQIRSSDEPMTSFITCLACGNNWRE